MLVFPRRMTEPRRRSKDGGHDLENPHSKSNHGAPASRRRGGGGGGRFKVELRHYTMAFQLFDIQNSSMNYSLLVFKSYFYMTWFNIY